MLVGWHRLSVLSIQSEPREDLLPIRNDLATVSFLNFLYEANMFRRIIAAFSVLFLSFLSQAALAGTANTPRQTVRNLASTPKPKPAPKALTPLERLLLPKLQNRLIAKPAAGKLQAALEPADASSALSVPNFGGYLAAPYYPASLKSSCVARLLTCGVAASVSADFNKDGKPDIAVLQYDGTLNVLLNQGGSFAAPVNYSNPNYSSTYIEEALAADINNDGYADIVAFDSGNNALIVFLNQKNGTFGAPQATNLTYSYGNFASIAVDDVNGDGIPDIVAVATNSNVPTSTDVTVQTLLGNGDGTFQTPSSTLTNTVTIPSQVGMPPYLGITLGDLNGDGKPDLAAVFEESTSSTTGQFVVSVAFGNGDGTFGNLGTNNPVSVPEVVTPGLPFLIFYSAGVQIQDVNRDSNPDLVVDANGTLYAALGDGNGNFPSIMLTPGFSTNSAVYADVTGDGVPDIIADDDLLEVWKGNGDGTFAAPVAGGQYIIDNGDSQDLTVADFDGDGNLDVAQLGPVFEQLSLFTGNGKGAFRGAPALGSTTDPYSEPFTLSTQAVADITGNGYTDMLSVDNSGAAPYIVAGLSDGKGNFTDMTALSADAVPTLGFLQPVAVDFNKDGRQDMLIAGTDGSLSVSLSKGDGTFQAPISLSLPSLDCELGYAAAADINDDGIPDIVATYAGDSACGSSGSTPSGYFVALGRGDGTFATPVFTPYGTELYSITIADMNSDGKPDLLLNDIGSGSFAVYLLNGNGDGTFGAGIAVSSDYIVSQVIAGDYNQDGKPDLILFSEGEATDLDADTTAGILLLHGNGDGTFGAPTQLATGNFFFNGSLTDVNGDGVPDIVAALYQTVAAPNTYYGLSTLLGEGGGAFSPPVNTIENLTSLLPLPGNFFNDNAPDFVVSTSYGPALFLGQGGTTFALGGSAASISFGQSETLTATVAATMSGRAAPTGIVTFYDGTTLLGSTAVNGTTASFATSALTVGSHTITAVYGGDSNFNPNTTSAVAVTVSSLAPAFTLSASATSLNLQRGQNGVATITLIANATFSDTVNLICSGLPAGATCTLNPASVTLAANGTGTATLVIGTTSGTAENRPHSLPWQRPAGGMLSLTLLVWGFRERRSMSRQLSALAIVVLSIAGLAIMGCGGSSVKTASKGAYTVTVAATPSSSTGAAQTVTLKVTVD
jgi:hypothetical protein